MRKATLYYAKSIGAAPGVPAKFGIGLYDSISDLSNVSPYTTVPTFSVQFNGQTLYAQCTTNTTFDTTFYTTACSHMKFRREGVTYGLAFTQRKTITTERISGPTYPTTGSWACPDGVYYLETFAIYGGGGGGGARSNAYVANDYGANGVPGAGYTQTKTSLVCQLWTNINGAYAPAWGLQIPFVLGNGGKKAVRGAQNGSNGGTPGQPGLGFVTAGGNNGSFGPGATATASGGYGGKGGGYASTQAMAGNVGAVAAGYPTKYGGPGGGGGGASNWNNNASVIALGKAGGGGGGSMQPANTGVSAVPGANPSIQGDNKGLGDTGSGATDGGNGYIILTYYY